MTGRFYSTDPTDEDLAWARRRLQGAVEGSREDDYWSTWRRTALDAAERALLFAKADDEDDAVLIRQARAMTESLWGRGSDWARRPRSEWS